MDSPPNYPDDLARAVIDALVADVDTASRPVRGVPPLFADREAALRLNVARPTAPWRAWRGRYPW